MRICVDLNVWVQDELVQRLGRAPSAASRIIDAVRQHRWGQVPLQLVASVQMLDTLRHVLITRREAEPRIAELYMEAIVDLIRFGPDKLDPHLILSGAEQFAVRDREDQGVMALAMTAMADLLVTSNLRDFITPKCEAIVTRASKGRSGTHQHHVQIHERLGGGNLIVADPIDAIQWLDNELEISAEVIRSHYARHKRLIVQ